MDNTKEVYFYIYCDTCKHRNEEETDCPCDDCLAIPMRFNSHKPEYYEKEE